MVRIKLKYTKNEDMRETERNKDRERHSYRGRESNSKKASISLEKSNP